MNHCFSIETEEVNTIVKSVTILCDKFTLQPGVDYKVWFKHELDTYKYWFRPKIECIIDTPKQNLSKKYFFV